MLENGYEDLVIKEKEELF